MHFCGVQPYYVLMNFPTHGAMVSALAGLRPAIEVGNKTRTTPPRPRNRDANGGTQSAEYPSVERSGIAVETSSASGWEGSVGKAISVVLYAPGHNWTATIDGSRESVLEPRENTEPQTPLRGILAL